MRKVFGMRIGANILLGIAMAFAVGGTAPVMAGMTPAPEGAQLYLISPADGAKITGPVHVVFGLRGMGVAPAGVDKAHTGHHHLLIDAPLPSGSALDDAIPKDDNYRHFGGGQTEAMLDLPAGKHTLQLLLGDTNHIPHNPPVHSKQITIWVE